MEPLHLHLILSAPATEASHASGATPQELVAASGPLHLQLPLYKTFFLQISSGLVLPYFLFVLDLFI